MKSEGSALRYSAVQRCTAHDTRWLFLKPAYVHSDTLTMHCLHIYLPVQMPSITRAIATRMIPGLLLYAAAAVALQQSGLLPGPAICAMALATISPMSTRTLELTHIFRLNENLVAAAARFSNSVAAVCALAVLLAAQRAATVSSVAELSYGLGMIALGVWLLMSYWSEGARKARGGESDFYRRTTKMVYKGVGAPQVSQADEPNDTTGRQGNAAALPSHHTAVRPTTRPGLGTPSRGKCKSTRPRPCGPLYRPFVRAM